MQSLGSILPLPLKIKFNSSQEKEDSSSLPTKFSLIALEPLIVEEESKSLHQLQWEEQKSMCVGGWGVGIRIHKEAGRCDAAYHSPSRA